MSYVVPVRFVSDDASLAQSQERVNAGFERMAQLAHALREQQERSNQSTRNLTSENKRLLNAQVDMERRFKELPKAVQQASRAFFEYENRIAQAQETMARLSSMTGPLSQGQGEQFAAAKRDAEEFRRKLQELHKTIVQVDAAQLRADRETGRGARPGQTTLGPLGDYEQVISTAKAGEVARRRYRDARGEATTASRQGNVRV